MQKKTSPYEFYQYWRNVADDDIENVMKLLTFIEPEEIEEMTKYKDERINEAKKVAAFEITKLVHGEEEAKKAEEATNAMFSGNGNIDAMEAKKVELNAPITQVIVDVGMAPSKGQAKTLISQGAITLNDEKISDIAYVLKEEDFTEGYAIIRKGKKVYYKLVK